MKKSLVFAVLGLALMLPHTASAVLIGFGSADNDLSSDYTEDGFTVSEVTGTQAELDSAEGRAGGSGGAALFMGGAGGAPALGDKVEINMGGALFTFQSVWWSSNVSTASDVDDIALIGLKGGVQQFSHELDGASLSFVEFTNPDSGKQIDVLRFEHVADLGNNGMIFDDVTLTAGGGAIPEPATLGMWGVLAGIGLIAVRRRQRKQAK